MLDVFLLLIFQCVDSILQHGTSKIVIALARNKIDMADQQEVKKSLSIQKLIDSVREVNLENYSKQD